MTLVGQLAAVVVGAAFVLAGGTKLAAAENWPRQAKALGAPLRVIPIVPWYELAVGALLVVQVARRTVALIALMTLCVFTALIVVRLKEGKHPVCACFGTWSAKPIGPSTVVRNGVLMAVSVVAAVA